MSAENLLGEPDITVIHVIVIGLLGRLMGASKKSSPGRRRDVGDVGDGGCNKDGSTQDRARASRTILLRGWM